MRKAYQGTGFQLIYQHRLGPQTAYLHLLPKLLLSGGLKMLLGPEGFSAFPPAANFMKRL